RCAQGAQAVGDGIARLDAIEVLKKPGAAGEHQMPVVLSLEQFEGASPIGGRCRTAPLSPPERERADLAELHVDIALLGCPGRLEQLAALAFGACVQPAGKLSASLATGMLLLNGAFGAAATAV